MGKMIISGAGGAGAGSEECTATRAELLKGYTAITNDSDDEMVEGTLELTGDAADSQVLAGKSYYNTNPKNKRAGSMVNQGAVNQTLNAGGSYTIPAGYHNGPGKVIANSLASQTGGTASAGHILSGQTAWVNGSKITGTLTIQSVASFSLAQYETQQIIASWALPSVGPWSGIRVMCKQGSYPAHAGDGTLFYEGAGTWASKQLAEGIWYFRSWNYITTNFGRNYGGYVQGSINNTAITGTQTFTSSGVFTVPAKVYAVNVFLVGGGAAGGYGDRSGNFEAGSGGGGGYTATHWNIPVTPGQTIVVSIGAGGSLNTNGYPNNGGNTTFGSYSVAGGTTYRNGGSGGGRGTYRKAGYPGGDGGSDGGNGGRADSNYGLGQHTTTRAFGEPNGTLYTCVGGGGGNGSEGVSYRGVGGRGGGGNGRDGWNAGSAGAVNTGGGGGDWCGWSDENGIRGSSGGSGICIVRWGY